MYGEARPSYRVLEYVEGLDIPGDRNDRMRHLRVKAYALTLDGELGGDGDQFIAMTGTNTRVLVDVVGKTLRIGQVEIGEDLSEDRVQIVALASLEGVEIHHAVTMTNPDWGDEGFVAKLEVKHPSLPGGSLLAEFDRHHAGGRQALAAVRRLAEIPQDD